MRSGLKWALQSECPFTTTEVTMKIARSVLVRFVLLVSFFAVSLSARATVEGCPWVEAFNASNKGVVDTNARYWDSLMPNSIADGTTVTIRNPYPHARFFSFTIYHTGRMVDHLADSYLTPVEGGSPNSNVSALPDSNNYNDHYQITIKYQDPPLVREPNTLYAGSDKNLARLLSMRIYLPDNGYDVTGGAGMPELTQVNPDGSSVRYDTTSSNLACPILAALIPSVYWFTLPTTGIPTAAPTFTVVNPATYDSGAFSFMSYANFDAGYGYVVTAPRFGDLMLIREKAPAMPSGPAAPADMQARYMSVCGYRSSDRYDLGCLADTQLVTQSDGYFNVVISTADMRPPLATAASGYNWLGWPNSTDKSLFIIRQILPNPGFAGNYQIAGGASNPIVAMGSWAPMATYCDTATFNANAAQGGAALFAACQTLSADKKNPKIVIHH
jgi:hypothetical protein